MEAPNRAAASSSSVPNPTASPTTAAAGFAQAGRAAANVSFATVLGRRAGVSPKALGDGRGAAAGAIRRGAPHGAGRAHAAAAGAEERGGGEVAVRGRKREASGDEPSDSASADDREQMPASGSPRAIADETDLLDPLARHAAHLAPPVTQAAAVDAAAANANEPVRARSLEELLPVLVRRIAWAGDRHKGTVHLELGAGAYAGTTVTVHADGGRVRVELGGAEGPELDRLRARLDARLRGHGLDVESVT